MWHVIIKRQFNDNTIGLIHKYFDISLTVSEVLRSLNYTDRRDLNNIFIEVKTNV